MKDIKFTVEFLTPCAASGAIGTSENKFQRDSAGNIILSATGWYTAIRSALSYTDLDLYPDDINVAATCKADTVTHTHFFNGGSVEHEAIAAGAFVTFDAVIPDDVSLDEVRILLRRLGTYVGISPFGHRLGYGKFNVTEVKYA